MLKLSPNLYLGELLWILEHSKKALHTWLALLMQHTCYSIHGGISGLRLAQRLKTTQSATPAPLLFPSSTVMEKAIKFEPKQIVPG
jgi:hypothetical protein